MQVYFSFSLIETLVPAQFLQKKIIVTNMLKKMQFVILNHH